MRGAAKVVRALRSAGRTELAGLVEARLFPLHLGAKADDAVGDAYRGLVGIKQAIDQMDDPPDEVKKLYREVLRAINATSQARQHTTQVREQMKRLTR